MIRQLDLVEDEVKIIEQYRQRREAYRWMAEGFFEAAKFLNGLGDQCAGGAGRDIDPKTALPFGNAYYEMASKLTEEGAKRSANLPKLKVVEFGDG